MTEIVQPDEMVAPAVYENYGAADLFNNAFAVVDEAQKEGDKANLIGVPHVITRATFRPGKWERGYVWLEATIGTQDMLVEAVQRGWIPTDRKVLYAPGEKVGYVDGSTGVRRKVVQILHNAGLLDVGEVNTMADFDKPWTEWQSFTQAGVMKDDKGEEYAIPDFTVGPTGAPFAIVARHGLRVSRIEEYGTDVYYLG